MLETLRAFGLDRLAAADELPESAAALTRHAMDVAQQAAAAMETSAGEVAGARWLDAEGVTMDQALTWALDHDPRTALQLALALARWPILRGRAAEGYELLTTAARQVKPGTSDWCAARFWLGLSASYISDLAGALDHFTAACDAPGTAVLSQVSALALCGRANMLLILGRHAEGAEEARRSLMVSRDLGYPTAEAFALLNMANAEFRTHDLESAGQWARQACQIDPTTIPGDLARDTHTFLAIVLADAGQDNAARASSTTALALAREAGDAEAEAHSLRLLAKLDLQAGQLADAQSHLGAALQLAARHRDFYRMRDCLLPGADMCAAAGLWAEAITLQAAERGCSEAAGLGTVPANKRRDELMRKAAQTLRPEQSQAAQQRGAAMTLDTAADFLLLLTETDLQTSPAPNAPPELSGLSAREQELVTLVAQGLTDAQIAGKLYISISTVRSHLDRIRDKTSCRRRADLTRLALQVNLA